MPSKKHISALQCETVITLFCSVPIQALKSVSWCSALDFVTQNFHAFEYARALNWIHITLFSVDVSSLPPCGGHHDICHWIDQLSMLVCKAGNNDVLLCGIITQLFFRLPIPSLRLAQKYRLPPCSGKMVLWPLLIHSIKIPCLLGYPFFISFASSNITSFVKFSFILYMFLLLPSFFSPTVSTSTLSSSYLSVPSISSYIFVFHPLILCLFYVLFYLVTAFFFLYA